MTIDVKVKSLLICSLFIGVAFSGKAQTKQETIVWLKEKFEKCLEGTYSSASQTGDGPWRLESSSLVKNIHLENINECAFIITYSKHDRNYRATFPVHIQSVKNLYENQEGMKATSCWSFSYSAQVVKVEDLTSGETGFQNAVWGIHIALNEENIHSRIEKALNHLASFCPKKKETF